MEKNLNTWAVRVFQHNVSNFRLTNQRENTRLFYFCRVQCHTSSSMAGTIQTLILTSSPTKSLLLSHRKLHFPAKYAISRPRSISPYRRRLSWSPIRARDSSSQVPLCLYFCHIVLFFGY